MGLFGIFSSSSSSSPVVKPEEQKAAEEIGGTCPLVVLTPPFGLQDPVPSDEDAGGGCGGGIVSKLLELFKGVGSDLTRFQVPVNFNMPKSQLQLYGESVYCHGGCRDLLSECADAESETERFVAVVRWHLSTTRPSPFGKAPYNPVLGETHHVSVGDLNILLEQVSHQPPVSALHATNERKGIELSFWQQPVPKFYGNGVEITIIGSRTLKLQKHDELYEMTSPKLGFRFLPVPGSDWSGHTTVYCAKTRLRASVSFKGKGFFGLQGRKVTGKIWNTSTGQMLYEMHGNWDQIVYLEDKHGTISTLYDGRELLLNLRAPRLQDSAAVLPTESALVWSRVSQAILQKDMDKARSAKSCTEEEQRLARKQRQGNWKPKFFHTTSSGSWEWQHPHPVPPAPIIL